MRRPLRGLALLALGGSAWGLPACAQTPDWQRAWTVQSFDCAACSADDRAWLAARIGQQVVLGVERFLNPLYEDCRSGADYADVLPRTPEQARQALGRDRLPPLQSTKPLVGQVRCKEASGPPNVVARIVIDGTRAYLLHESGAIVTLR